VQGGLLLDVVVLQSAVVLKLLPGEDKALLVRGNSFLILDLLLNGLDVVAGLNIQGNRFSS